MEGSLSTAQKMLQFITESPSCFHAVDTLKRKLDRHGFQELKEQEISYPRRSVERLQENL